MIYLYNEYLKERIMGAAYKLSYGIKFNIALNLTRVWLRKEDLYAKNITVKASDKADIIAREENNQIIIQVEEDKIII